MKLPNAENAVVERSKIVDYLLDEKNPQNGGKAEFFGRFGFQKSDWQVLASAFLNLARTMEVRTTVCSPHGDKYVVTGRIDSPVGRPVTVQSIWIVDKGAKTARFITAYPSPD